MLAVRQDRPHYRTHISNRARLPGFPGGQARACRLRRSANHRGRRRRDQDSGRANCCTATSPASAGSRAAASPRRNSPGGGVPGMKTTWLARKLGLDGNPLRRRTDKIAAWAAALLVAVFLIGAPLLSVAAARLGGSCRGCRPAGGALLASGTRRPAAGPAGARCHRRDLRPFPGPGPVDRAGRAGADRPDPGQHWHGRWPYGSFVGGRGGLAGRSSAEPPYGGG